VETLVGGEAAIVAVADCGPRIHAEDLPRVFEPFYRSDRLGRAGVPGAGLAVVERIATAPGGAVSIDQ
jgi:signal transduction histidine kinase